MRDQNLRLLPHVSSVSIKHAKDNCCYGAFPAAAFCWHACTGTAVHTPFRSLSITSHQTPCPTTRQQQRACPALTEEDTPGDGRARAQRQTGNAAAASKPCCVRQSRRLTSRGCATWMRRGTLRCRTAWTPRWRRSDPYLPTATERCV